MNSFDASGKYLEFLIENFDNAFFVGVIMFLIVGIIVLTQIRNGGIKDISFAYNKFKFLTPLGRLFLIIGYLVFFSTIAVLLLGLFSKG